MAVQPKTETLLKQMIAENPSDYVEKASDKLIRENQKAATKVLTDSLGRRIIYRNLNPLEQARVYKALGEFSSNEAYAKYCMVACAVQSIDDERGPAPTTILGVEARIDWVGEDGFTVIWTDLIAELRELQNSRSAEEIAEEHRNTVKKSSQVQD
jgi:hypothetical protein